VLAAVLLAAPLSAGKLPGGLRWAWLGLAFMICAGSYAWCHDYWQGRLEAALPAGRTIQTLSYGDYLHRFNPRQTVLRTLRSHECLKRGVHILARELIDGGAIYDHGGHHRVRVFDDPVLALDILKKGGCVYVVGRGGQRTPALPMAEGAELVALDDGTKFYRLYRWRLINKNNIQNQPPRRKQRGIGGNLYRPPQAAGY